MRFSGYSSQDFLKLYAPVFLASIAFLLFRYYGLLSIYSGRDLPIEVDDALIYILNFDSNFLGVLKDSVSFRSAREFATKIFEVTSSEHAYFASNWTKGGGYIGYSLWSKFLTEAITQDPFKTLILQSYFIQPILLISFLLFARAQTDLDIVWCSLAVVLHACSSIENIHLLTATPFSYSLAFVLLGATALKKSHIATAFIFYTIALSFHPGAFLGIFMIFLSLIAEKYHKFQPNSFWQLTKFFKDRELYIQPAFVIIFISLIWILSPFTTLDLLMLGDGNTKINHDTLGLLLENASAGFIYIVVFFSKYTFIWISLPLLVFVFFFKNTSIKVKSLLFAWGIAWLLTLLNYIPGHPGGLTSYLLQYLGVFVPLYLAQLMSDQKLILLNGSIGDSFFRFPFRDVLQLSKLLVVCCLFIYLCVSVYVNLHAQIKSRIERQNFMDVTHVIQDLDQKFDKKFQFITQDKISYLFFLNSLQNRTLKYLNMEDATPMFRNQLCNMPFVLFRLKGGEGICPEDDETLTVWKDNHFIVYVNPGKDAYFREHNQ